MPKVVNVEEHKIRISSAAWRLVASQGLDAVSLRSVATEAGVSMGQVQHYFTSKNDLLYGAVEHSYRLIEQHLEQKLSSPATNPREFILTLLSMLLGSDEVMRDAIRVNVAFGARTQNEPRIHELLTSGDVEIQAMCEEAIKSAQAAGQVDADIDPRLEALVIFGLATGLGTQVAIYQDSPEKASSTFSYYVSRLGLV